MDRYSKTRTDNIRSVKKNVKNIQKLKRDKTKMDIACYLQYMQYNTIITWSSAPLSRHHYGSARTVSSLAAGIKKRKFSKLYL